MSVVIIQNISYFDSKWLRITKSTIVDIHTQEFHNIDITVRMKQRVDFF
jgi:hypothetical protein